VGAGEALSALGGVVLVAAMFLDWFGVDVSGRLPGIEALGRTIKPVNAWQAFDAIDIVLLFAAVLALATALAAIAGSGLRLPIETAVLVAALGALAAALIAWRLADPPITQLTSPTVTVDVTREVGAYLGLVAAAAIAAGGWLALRRGQPADDGRHGLS
jgi:hypothetical protein